MPDEEVERLPDARAVRYVGLGKQDFPTLRLAGGLYVDKTDLIYKLVHGSMYQFLSRPKRFGKSLLVSTLEAYWQGRRWLFEGLRIAALESEWAEHFVVRLDMSGCGEHLYMYHSYINSVLTHYEAQLSVPPPREDELRGYGARLSRVLRAAHEATGRRVVVLVDEYDYLLQHTWNTSEYEACAQAYREFFPTLKAEEAHLKYVFLTGITRFSFVGIFSTLNNLDNISFDEPYAYLCGITEAEMRHTFGPELEALAKKRHQSVDEVVEQLRYRFDGYHFALEAGEGLYNPFFLLAVLSKMSLNVAIGEANVPTAVQKFVKPEVKIPSLENCTLYTDTLMEGNIYDGNLPVLLYQAGFLTLRGGGEEVVRLGFPNPTVRRHLFNDLLPGFGLLDKQVTQTLQQRLKRALQAIDIEQIALNLKALLAKVPFHHIDKEAIKHEERYALATATVLGSLGYETQQEVVCSTGVTDLVSKTEHQIYVCECKLRGNGGLSAAARQLREKGYEAQFAADPREKVLLALEFDDQGGGLLELRRVKG